MTLNLTLDAKYQVEGHGYVSSRGRLSVAFEIILVGTRDEVILGRYPVPRLLTLNLTLKMTLKSKMKVILVFSVLNLNLERGLE